MLTPLRRSDAPYSTWRALGLLILLPVITHATQAPDQAVLIENVTVIDATGSPPRSGMHVLIEDGYIVSIGNGSAERAAIERLDGTGRFLIPGLWDMHAHWSKDIGPISNGESYLPLFLVNGVTGIRMMWGNPEHYEWKARLYDDDFITPRIELGSDIIDGPNKMRPSFLAAGSASAGRRYVRQFHEVGADFIKVYSMLPRDAYFAIASESRALGMPFVGHVPMQVDAEEASDAGQKSFEHLTGVDLALSRDRDAIQEMIADAISSGAGLDLSAIDARYMDTYDPTLAAPLFERLKRNGTWQVPTLVMTRNFAYVRERKEIDRERLSFLPASIQEFWDPEADPELQSFTEENWETTRRLFEHMKMIVGDMNRAGVEILAGSDVLNPIASPASAYMTSSDCSSTPD